MIVSLIVTLTTLSGTPVTTTSYHPSHEACQSVGAEVATATADRFHSMEFDCVLVSQERLTFDDL